MPITNEVLDQILGDYEKPEDLLSENALLQQLTKVPDRLSGCAESQGQKRRARRQQIDLSGVRRDFERLQGSPRGCQVLAPSRHRIEESRRAGYFYRLRRRTQGLARSD
jgi:hypothetical protein